MPPMEPNTLYITISLPRLPPYHPLPPTYYHASLPPKFDPKTYETGIATTNTSEEFSWGVYWIDVYGRGTLYTLDRLPQPINGIIHVLRMTFVQPQVIQFESSMIGMIKLLSIPANIHHGIETYLAWLTSLTATGASRSLIWAISTYARCRKHIVHKITGEDQSEHFDINAFLEEALGLAYEEVGHALMGRGVVAVWESQYGVEVIDDGEDEYEDETDDDDASWLTEEEFYEDEISEEELEYEKAWPLPSDVYPVS